MTIGNYNSAVQHQNRVGEEVGHLVLTDENNVQVHLADFRGSWLWMIFHRHLG